MGKSWDLATTLGYTDLAKGQSGYNRGGDPRVRTTPSSRYPGLTASNGATPGLKWKA